MLLETFLDPHRFAGTIYTAANWVYVGGTKGFRRTPGGYSATAQFPKRVSVKPLRVKAQTLLSHPVLAPQYHHGASNQTQALPASFAACSIPVAPKAGGTKARARVGCRYQDGRYLAPGKFHDRCRVRVSSPCDHSLCSLTMILLSPPST